MIDLTQSLMGVVRTISGTIRPDKDTPKSEAVLYFLDIDYSGCTLTDVLDFANSDRKIAWAATGREHIGTIKPGQHIKVMAANPGRRATVDPKVQLRNEIEGMSDEEARDYLLAKVKEVRS